MKKIALISVTLNAVNPMTEYFLSNVKEARLLNYLDTELMEIVNRDGKVSDKAMGRMLELISRACDDGADGILLTYTVFTPYVEMFQQLFSVPVISADGAMLEKAAKMGGRTAILCTFPATMESSRQIYTWAAVRQGKEADIKMFLLKDAFEAMKIGDKALHNSLIADKVMEIERDFDIIVLAQISMAPAARQINCKKPVLTSIGTSFSGLMEVLNQK